MSRRCGGVWNAVEGSTHRAQQASGIRGGSFGDKVSASWSDWISGDWLRGRSVMPSTRLLEASFGVTSRPARRSRWNARGDVRHDRTCRHAPTARGATADADARTPVSIVTSRAEISLALEELGVNPSPLELALGHLGDLQVSARDVTWGGRRVDRLIVTARNVHVRPGRNAVFVAAPVDVTVTICQASLDDWLGPSRHARLNLLDDAVAISRRGQELWGSVEFEPRVGPSDLSFIPHGAVAAVSPHPGTSAPPGCLAATSATIAPRAGDQEDRGPSGDPRRHRLGAGDPGGHRTVPASTTRSPRRTGCSRFTVDDLAPRADDG